ncbi:putative toxin-antitoxin system toxin component, PIN family [Candidatus Saganbacteria bacterium]|nr:putative toxin-antitoxin system toxin component, PIN family [Candidatus Saganbacteria bacterium]
MLKIVLDTNILVSIFIKRSEAKQKIIDALKRHDFQLVISEAILAEIIAVLQRPNIRKLTKMTKREILELGKLLLEESLKVLPSTKSAVCRDLDDNKFIDCAVAAKADYIVSGDNDLLELSSYQGIKIITLRAFLLKSS